MTVARTEHRTNTVLGNGEIFVDVLDADGNLQGERYLGDSVGATISITSERTTIQSGDGAVGQDLVDIVRSVSRTMGFTLRDSSIANWALFLIGEASAAAVTADKKTDEAHALGAMKKDLWYQIGATALNPMGVGAISATGFGAKDDTTALTADTDFEIDAAAGRIMPKKDIEKPKLTYTPVASPNRRQAKASAAAKQITCALRYIEDAPAAGQGRHVYIRKCNLVPGGESALKSRETEQQMAFTAAVQDPGGSIPAIVIDGIEL